MLIPWISGSDLRGLRMGNGQLVSRILERMLGLYLIASGELLKGLESDIHLINIHLCQELF